MLDSARGFQREAGMPVWTMVNCLHCGAKNTVIGNWIPRSSSVKCWTCGAPLGAWHETIQKAEESFSKALADGEGPMPHIYGVHLSAGAAVEANKPDPPFSARWTSEILLSGL